MNTCYTLDKFSCKASFCMYFARCIWKRLLVLCDEILFLVDCLPLRWDYVDRKIDVCWNSVLLGNSRETFEMKDQNDDGKKSNKRRHPSVTDEAIGWWMLGVNGPFNKGPWTSAEDTILREYVQKHGEGNWHLVHTTTGLLRCGRSCRLRWVNHLRPDLSKGPLTPNEKQRIAQLHAQMGNKWAKMAAELPGRTDNEIKNYWNARKTRPKSRNMPLYPGGSQGCQYMGAMQQVDQRTPNVKFRNLDLDRLASSLSPSLFDMPASSLVKQGISSPNTHSFAFPTLRPSKRPRESETKSSGERIPEPNSLCTQYDSDLSSTYDQPEIGVLSGGHVLLNDYTSSSEPMYGPMNLELPSFQYSETQQDSWCMPTSPLPSFESVDTSIQSESLWLINSGLSDSSLYEPNSDKSLQRSFVQQDPEASSVSQTDAADRSFISPLLADQNTHLGRSASSLFSESTPISRTSASYDPGRDFNHEAVDQASTQQPEEKGNSEFSGPDVSPGPWRSEKWRK